MHTCSVSGSTTTGALGVSEPSWRGRGYGDALLAAVLELLVAEGTPW